MMMFSGYENSKKAARRDNECPFLHICPSLRTEAPQRNAATTLSDGSRVQHRSCNKKIAIIFGACYFESLRSIFSAYSLYLRAYHVPSHCLFDII